MEENKNAMIAHPITGEMADKANVLLFDDYKEVKFSYVHDCQESLNNEVATLTGITEDGKQFTITMSLEMYFDGKSWNFNKAVFTDNKAVENTTIQNNMNINNVKETNNIDTMNTNVAVNFNTDKKGIELKFASKPNKDILNKIKSEGFRWSKFKKIWSAKDTKERRMFLQELGLYNTNTEVKSNLHIDKKETTSKTNIDFKCVENMQLSEVSRYIKKCLKTKFSGTKFSVTSRHVYGITIKFEETEELTKQNVINFVGLFSQHTSEDIEVNNSFAYYTCTEQYEEEQRIKYEQEQKELEAQRDEREQMYNNNVKVESIHNAKITNVADKDIFVIALEPAINKNDWKTDNDKYIDEKSYSQKYKITDIIELNEDEYNYFCFNLLEDYKFLSNKGGTCYDDEADKVLYNYAIVVTCRGKEPIIIDPQGYSYARYTCRLVEDIDNKLKNILNKNSNNSNELILNDDLYTNTIDNIVDTDLYIFNEGNLWTYLENKIYNDERFIYNKYDSIVAITGLTYKEMLINGEGVKTILNKINKPINDFAEYIIKIENGECMVFFGRNDIKLRNIKFSERLTKELKRANNKPTPEPPKPTKNDNDNIKVDNTNNKQQINNNIINVDFTNKHTLTNSKINSTIKTDNCINFNNYNWDLNKATKKQLWALHCITKLNTTNLIITKNEASNLITNSKKGINIISNVKRLLDHQQLLQA